MYFIEVAKKSLKSKHVQSQKLCLNWNKFSIFAVNFKNIGSLSGTTETYSALIFDLTKQTTEGEVMHLYFEQKNNPPQKVSNRILIAHGFHKEITIQYFPLRGNAVYLHIKRRRWLDKKTKEIAQRDWNLVAQGSRSCCTTSFF